MNKTYGVWRYCQTDNDYVINDSPSKMRRESQKEKNGQKDYLKKYWPKKRKFPPIL